MGWREIRSGAAKAVKPEPAVSLAPEVSDEQAASERVAKLDQERNDRDRAAHRGYDYDTTVPSNAEFVERQRPTTGRAAALVPETRVEMRGLRTARLVVPEDDGPLPPAPPRAAAKSLITTCREYGVKLKLDPDQTLVVVSNGKAWRGLVDAIEVHVDDVVQLIIDGWDGTNA
jgi:hypothetical protein